MDSFAQIDISQNKLDFSDAPAMKLIDERIAYQVSLTNAPCCGGYSTVTDFRYTPQKPFGTIDTTTILTYNDTTLSIADQHYADNYQWYRNGVAIAGATDTLLPIYCATQADAGIYTCHSIGQYFNTHSFRFNYGITEFTSESKTLIVSPTIGKQNLAALYPTVSSGTVTLKYSIPEEQTLIVKVYDMAGAEVYTTDLGTRVHGVYTQPLDLSFLPSGSYIAAIQYSKGYNRRVRLVILQ
jgi:hypothetical protein